MPLLEDTETIGESSSPTGDTIPDTSDNEASVGYRSPLARFRLSPRNQRIAEWTTVLAAIYILITAVTSIGSGFKLAVGDQAAEIFQFAANPFVGLVIGILATVLTQSSTTTTSITVGLVAGGLPIGVAIPILLGANVGTTMTSTLVSLGMARDKESFRRAFGAATIHDMYNLLSVAIFLPLELTFGVLEKSSAWLASQTSGSDGGVFGVIFGAIGSAVNTATAPGKWVLSTVTSPLPPVAAGITQIVLGVALILAVINLIGRLLKVLMVGKAEQVLHKAIGRGPMSGITSGTLMTVMVQSSTTTTSLAVPLAGSGTFSLKQVYPFTIGANIGTTLTALIAAFGFTGAEATVALQAAYVHVLYNVFCALVIYGLPLLRPIPLMGASWLADLAVKSKKYVAIWVLGVFVVIPSTLIAVTAIGS